MNIREDTREEMAAFREAGRLNIRTRPRLSLRLPRRVPRGEPFEIAWTAAFAGRVELESITSGGRALVECVPPRGRRRVTPAASGEFLFRLRADPRPSRFGRASDPAMIAGTVDVFVPPPTIDLVTPAVTHAVEPVEIAWTVRDADQVALEIDGESEPVAMADQRLLTFASCGAHRLAIVAMGEGGEREQARSIRVTAPPITITAPSRVAVEIGDIAEIEYAVRGAESVIAETFGGGGPPLQVAAAGRIEVAGVRENMRVRIAALGYDGACAAKIVAIDVLPMRFVSIDAELDFLNSWSAP